MLFFKDVVCNFYFKEINNSFKAKEFECKVVCQSGIASLGIYEMGLQFLIDEKVLRKVLLEYKSTEADTVYINFTDENVIPVKCKIKLDVTASEIKFEILNINSFFEIRTEQLKKILDIR